VRGLDKLRGLARAGVERMLIILGASGCGKSSFLRAGLWPRLKRDDRSWLPLPTIRPERAVIAGKFGLVESLYRIMNEAPFAEKLQKQELPRSRADIEEFVNTRDDGLLKILAALREAGHVPGLSGEETPPPTIVIPIDQGEELFNEDGRAEAKRFIDILTKTLAADPGILALFTMRTDSFPQFQNDPVLATVPKDTFTLDMMLEGSYREVIEGPAALVKPKPLKIDPQLTEALLQDAAGQDALPLLAFTLWYLYDQYQANNELSLGSYEKLGRLKGVIETTVKQALAEGFAKGELPKDDKAQLALIRKAFIPPLARVNAAGQFVRRIATRAEIPPEAQPVIDCLTEARLLIKDRRAIGGEDVEVIEVTHEALLREWRDLNSALLEEREFLIAKGELEQDVAEWQATRT
jgi:Novel STAND NTPase 1